MVRSSFVALLALSISANFVLGVQVFNADPATLEQESSVKALKSTDRSEESHKAHEEPIRNETKTRISEPILAKDEIKNETLNEEAKKASNVSLVLTSTDQNATAIATPIPNIAGGNVTRSIEETTPVNKVNSMETKVGNFTGEQADLNKPKVVSHDVEEEEAKTIVTQKNETAAKVDTLGTTLPSIVDDSSKSATVTTNVSIDPPMVVSVFEDDQGTKELNSTMYQTNSSELANATEAVTNKAPDATTVVTNVNATNAATTVADTANATIATIATTTVGTTIAKNVITSDIVTSKKNQVEGENVTTTLEGLEVIKQAELTEKNKESSDGSKNGSMPSGIIALVTAITFAVAIVIGYISMVVWKQYLEHRYGRRELLVNELEFDTNDLRHFEL